MSLPNEIRETLYNAGGVLHIENIRMMALAARVEGKKPQKLKTFTNAIYAMEDVEFIELDGIKHYVVFKSQTNHSLGFHIKGIMAIVKTRVILWVSLASEKKKVLMSRLENVRFYIRKTLKKYER